jgi:hypothetical protein
MMVDMLPDGVNDIVDLLVPELQRRGCSTASTAIVTCGTRLASTSARRRQRATTRQRLYHSHVHPGSPQSPCFDRAARLDPAAQPAQIGG